MTHSFGEYQRLARSALGFSSVWLGADHLLQIKGSGFLLPFSEEYQRFRYRDIQACTLARTASVWPRSLAYLVGLAATIAVGFFLLFQREPGEIALLATTLAIPLPIGVMLLALLIRHLVLGPLCVCEIRTTLSKESLPAIRRWHQGREALARLSEKVHAAQADLADREDSRDSTGETPANREADRPSLRVPTFTTAAFTIQASLGAILVLLLHLPSLILAGLMLGLAVLSGTPLLVALGNSTRHPTPEPLRRLLWTQLVAEIGLGATATVYFIDQAINDPSLTTSLVGILEAFADISALGGFVFYLLFLIVGLAQMSLAFAGLARTRHWQNQLSSPISGAA